MKLVKNPLESLADLSSVVYTSEHVQMLFNGRRHFIEVCEMTPNQPDAESVFIVELGVCPDRSQCYQLNMGDITIIDQAVFSTLGDAIQCLNDTVRQTI